MNNCVKFFVMCMIFMPSFTNAQNLSNPSSEIKFKSNEDSLWYMVKKEQSIEAMERYMLSYPHGAFVDSIWIIYKANFGGFDEVVVFDGNEDEEITDDYNMKETLPSFPGGDEAYIKYITENAKYPMAAKEAGLQGTVYITFTVNENGSVSNVWVIKGVGGGCDEEAVRVISSMPLWNPCISRGKAVKCRMNIPITFALQYDEYYEYDE